MAGLLSAASPLKRPTGVALLVGVTLAHLWLGDELLEDRLGFGAGAQSMRRIEVSYVRELALAPPPEPPAPAPARRGAAAQSRGGQGTCVCAAARLGTCGSTR